MDATTFSRTICTKNGSFALTAGQNLHIRVQELGEIGQMADIVRLGARRKRRMSDFYDEDWGCWRGEGFIEIGKTRAFTGETLRILFLLIGSSGRGNRIMMSAEQVADELGIRKNHVGEQFKKLAAAGVLIKGKYDWRLNPKYGFKGEPDKDLRRAAGGELVLID